MIVINRQVISTLAEEAKASARLRKNLNFHHDYSDPVNRMLNAFEPGTYVQPHKHEDPDKCEVFILLSGKAAAIRFDNAGTIVEYTILDRAEGVYGIEFAAREWHMIASLASGTVLYEVKPGPYTPINDKNFAKWAPPEGSPDAAAYLQSVLDRIVS